MRAKKSLFLESEHEGLPALRAHLQGRYKFLLKHGVASSGDSHYVGLEYGLQPQ